MCEDAAEGDSKIRTKEMAVKVGGFTEKHEVVFKGQSHPWFAGEPEGKLAAFFRWQESINQGFLSEFKWDEGQRRFVPVRERILAANDRQ